MTEFLAYLTGTESTFSDASQSSLVVRKSFQKQSDDSGTQKSENFFPFFAWSLNKWMWPGLGCDRRLPIRSAGMQSEVSALTQGTPPLPPPSATITN